MRRQQIMRNLLFGLVVLCVTAAPALAQPDKPIPVSSPKLPSHNPTNHVSDLRRPEIQVLERKELAGGLVREKLRLPGFDPDEVVPAVAVHPAAGGPFPIAICLHSFRGAKENLESWCRDLAARGVFAITLDAHLHGERSIAGVFHGDNIASLGGEYSIWVHQSSVARTAKDVPIILDALAARADVDAARVAATGVSMGASTAMVLAWREPRVRVVASVVGAVDFWWDVTKLPPGPEQEQRKASYGPRLRELVAAIDPRPRFAQIPPKALCLVNSGHDEYIDIESVRRFVADLEPLYATDRDRLRFVPFPDAGHGVTDAMWKEAQEWIVRGLQEMLPSGQLRPGTRIPGL
jgi:pimeloyl-ACP methyl ester carboxylesterase